MNPTALRALLEGDLENALIASTPGGIEAQEARGQGQFVQSETLPIALRGDSRTILETAGVVFGDPVDDLFQSVTLPPGWSKRATDHSMWSELVDGEGKVCADIFYKAAFYDRDAFLRLR